MNLLDELTGPLDSPDLRSVLFARIGGPGQYSGRNNDPSTFYLPLAGHACQIKLTFDGGGGLVRIEPGPAFDANVWTKVAEDVQGTSATKIGREFSFSSFRVEGHWRGTRSGVQILPPPPDAARAPVEMAEHPFVLEFPFRGSDAWEISTFRRFRQQQELTWLLNVLLLGHTTMPLRQPRHFWAISLDEEAASPPVKWVQEFYFANLGPIVRDELSVPSGEPLEEIDPQSYYARMGHDGRQLRVPSDLDESICSFKSLSLVDRDNFSRAGFWMDMASRQWNLSFSASFASLVIAIESLGDRASRPAKRFRDFIEQYAPQEGFADRRDEMYELRSEILHGERLMAMEMHRSHGWEPPVQNDRELMEGLWRLTQAAMRKWLRCKRAR